MPTVADGFAAAMPFDVYRLTELLVVKPRQTQYAGGVGGSGIATEGGRHATGGCFGLLQCEAFYTPDDLMFAG